MNKQTDVVNEIRKMCANVDCMLPMGWHFMYNERHFFYVHSSNDFVIRFCIPHLVMASDYDASRVTEDVNETNKNVKYIKVIILDGGSISLDYDHWVTEGERMGDIVPHIIKALDFASVFLINKLNAT